jgi:hypothetical protein
MLSNPVNNGKQNHKINILIKMQLSHKLLYIPLDLTTFSMLIYHMCQNKISKMFIL